MPLNFDRKSALISAIIVMLVVFVAPTYGVETDIPTVTAGLLTDPDGDGPQEADSILKRLDPNLASSPFAGVGSVAIGTFICSGVLVSHQHVLSAAHCFDRNGDGTVDVSLSILRFHLHAGTSAPENFTTTRSITSIDVHPEFDGWNINKQDDLAILTLVSPVPETYPIYRPLRDPLPFASAITFVGFGDSGDPENGYTVPASLTVKRWGSNITGATIKEDDAEGTPNQPETYRFQFENPLSAGSLGNTVEAITGPGDSGGPAFLQIDGDYLLIGISNFTGPSAPQFGSTAGGTLVHAYLEWFDAIVPAPPPAARDTQQVPVQAATVLGLACLLGWSGQRRLASFH